MNYYEILSQAAVQNPERRPGASGAATILQLFKTLAAGLNLNQETITVPVYRFKNSLWGFIALGTICILSGYAFPLISFAGSLLLAGGLVMELSQPLLGRFTPAQAQNLLVNLPAKNKEVQKIFLIASYDSEGLIETPSQFRPEQFLAIIFGIAAALVLSSMAYCFLHASFFNHFNLLLLLVTGVINLGSSGQETVATLKNCAALLETASILSKVKPDITSVTLCFCGSRALNSGVLALQPELAKGPKELTYVVNLSETANPNVAKLQLVTNEGALLSKNANALLVSTLQEVAVEKALATEAVKTTDYPETYGLDRAKVNPITIMVPQTPSVSVRAVRELLCGLVRKLDH